MAVYIGEKILTWDQADKKASTHPKACYKHSKCIRGHVSRVQNALGRPLLALLGRHGRWVSWLPREIQLGKRVVSARKSAGLRRYQKQKVFFITIATRDPAPQLVAQPIVSIIVLHLLCVSPAD
jgi:hypothetical protein